eukprot:9432859-Pyramimonas_sp.AAC.1
MSTTPPSSPGLGLVSSQSNHSSSGSIRKPSPPSTPPMLLCKPGAGAESTERARRRLVPDTEQIAKLGLKQGRNDLKFTFRTSVGTQEVRRQRTQTRHREKS